MLTMEYLLMAAALCVGVGYTADALKEQQQELVADFKSSLKTQLPKPKTAKQSVQPVEQPPKPTSVSLEYEFASCCP